MIKELKNWEPETPTCIPPVWCISIRVAFRTDLAIHRAPASASAVASAPADWTHFQTNTLQTNHHCTAKLLPPQCCLLPVHYNHTHYHIHESNPIHILPFMKLDTHPTLQNIFSMHTTSTNINIILIGTKTRFATTSSQRYLQPSWL